MPIKYHIMQWLMALAAAAFFWVTAAQAQGDNTGPDFGDFNDYGQGITIFYPAYDFQKQDGSWGFVWDRNWVNAEPPNHWENQDDLLFNRLKVLGRQAYKNGKPISWDEYNNSWGVTGVTQGFGYDEEMSYDFTFLDDDYNDVVKAEWDPVTKELNLAIEAGVTVNIKQKGE